jgi:hypothetical protein
MFGHQSCSICHQMVDAYSVDVIGSVNTLRLKAHDTIAGTPCSGSDAEFDPITNQVVENQPMDPLI